MKKRHGLICPILKSTQIQKKIGQVRLSLFLPLSSGTDHRLTLTPVTATSALAGTPNAGGSPWRMGVTGRGYFQCVFVIETCFAESDAAAIKHTVTRIEKTIGVVKTYLQLKA